MRFSPAQLQALAQEKYKANQPPQSQGNAATPQTPGFVTETNGTGQPPSVNGVSDYIMERVNNGAYNMNLASITHGDGATRDALVNAGYGDWVKGAYERAMDQRAAHYGGNGAQDAMANAQLGWYNDRYGNYSGGQQPAPGTTVSSGPNANQPPPPATYSDAARRAGGMFNALSGANNLVRGINGTQTPEQLQQTANAEGLTSMSGPITPKEEFVIGCNPAFLPEEKPPGVREEVWQSVQQPQQPSWSPVPNSATAGAPPGHGGSNPGYSGMLQKPGERMAAIQALIASLARR